MTASGAFLGLGIREWLMECWHLWNTIKIIKQSKHRDKWFNLYLKTSVLINVSYKNWRFCLQKIVFLYDTPMHIHLIFFLIF